MAELSDGVALTELGVITRWSLAVRVPEAERVELIAELRADLAWLESSGFPRASERTQELTPAKPTARLRRLSKTTPAPTVETPAKIGKPAAVKPVSGAPRRRRPAGG